MTGWMTGVYLNDEIDTVFYDSDCAERIMSVLDEEYVRRGLISHDGYDPSITVSTEAEDNAEFEDLIESLRRTR